MQLTTCLASDGDCRQALESCARLLGGKVVAMMRSVPRPVTAPHSH